MSYLGKGNKRTKLTEKIAGDFFRLKEFYLEYEVLTFPHSIYSIIIFHNPYLLFMQLKSRGAQFLLCRMENHLFRSGHKEMKIHSMWNSVPRQQNGIGRRTRISGFL